MCGFAGVLSRPGSATAEQLASVALRMAGKLKHRGPDDEGVWVDPEAGLAFANRRLAIIDLSPEGHQPMHSSNRRFVITYNGEIYNHREIRRQLELEAAGSQWRGYCDTEVILAAVVRWGIYGAVQRFNGMFAFALWDRHERKLYLCRDRIGEKPLYYAWLGNALVFGSELKALAAHPAWSGDIDRRALTLFLRHNCVPAPYSIYSGVAKLQPGMLLEQAWLGDTNSREGSTRPYWSAAEVSKAALRNPYSGSAPEAEAELDALLCDAVSARMQSDVPLGVFLSGGVDSSTVTALMQVQSTGRVRTFSLGFTERSYDESGYARAVAEYLGTEHVELIVTPEETMAVIPKLAGVYDEPFADSSQIPTLLISELARRDVTVCLSGDGGDELFGGYYRYSVGSSVWGGVRWFPHWARSGAARMIRSVPPEKWDAVASQVEKIMPSRYRLVRAGDNIHKLTAVLEARSGIDAYWALSSHWMDPSTLVRGVDEPGTLITAGAAASVGNSLVDQMMLLDLITYLPDDILVKLDRASMSVSLEARVPFLDHRVVEFAWRLPRVMKIRRGKGKWLLRKVLERYLPPALVRRPKMGFGIPLGQWLRGPLRDWAEALLAYDRLNRGAILDPVEVRRKWDDHLAGRRNWSHHLWDILMFEAWLEAQ